MKSRHMNKRWGNMCQCIFDPQVMVSSSEYEKIIFARTIYDNEPLIRKEEEEELLVRMIATIKMNKMIILMIKTTTMTRSPDSGPGGWHPFYLYFYLRYLLEFACLLIFVFVIVFFVF